MPKELFVSFDLTVMNDLCLFCFPNCRCTVGYTVCVNIHILLSTVTFLLSYLSYSNNKQISSMVLNSKLNLMPKETMYNTLASENDLLKESN